MDLVGREERFKLSSLHGGREGGREGGRGGYVPRRVEVRLARVDLIGREERLQLSGLHGNRDAGLGAGGGDAEGRTFLGEEVAHVQDLGKEGGREGGREDKGKLSGLDGNEDAGIGAGGGDAEGVPSFVRSLHSSST